MKWFKRRGAPAPAPKAARRMKISRAALATLPGGSAKDLELTPLRETPKVEHPFRPAAPMPGVKADTIAFDNAMAAGYEAVEHHEGIGFLGYAYLAQLAQRSEYRNISETIAEEMTREWIQLVSTADDDEGESFGSKAKALKKEWHETEIDEVERRQEIRAEWDALFERQDAAQTPRTEKIKKIDARLRKLKVRDHFRRVAELDGLFGRAHIYIDTGKTDDAAELKTALIIDRRKIRKKSLKHLTVVEPTWAYPNQYNSTNPLKANFYKPDTWIVMATEVHRSRLLTFVGREVPDILKPAYAFGGLSMSQMAMPYVQNWLRTRQSVSDLLAAFTTWVLKTDMGTLLEGGSGDDVINRIEVFNRFRDNRGTMVLNKGDGGSDTGEEFSNISVPLGTLDKLQAQSQEQMAAVARIPLVKLLGITPSGLNASSDGEIRVFYDHIAAYQEKLFGAHLETVLQIVQLDLFGEIDPDIGYEFKPLWQLDEAQQAAARKADADIDCAYLDRGALSAQEVRRKIASDRKSPYASLDVDDVPEPPEEEAPEHEAEGEEPDDERGAMDAEWREDDHKRAPDGKFGSGGASEGAAKEGPFGPIFTQFKGDPAGAVAHLKQTKSGEAVGALHHPDLGDIDLVWGKEGTDSSDGYGLAKLLKWHPDVVDNLQPVLSEMKIRTRTKNRVQLESPDHKGAIRLDWDGQAKHWLLTAFKKSGAAGTRTDTAGDEGGMARSPGAEDSVPQLIRKFYRTRGG